MKAMSIGLLYLEIFFKWVMMWMWSVGKISLQNPLNSLSWFESSVALTVCYGLSVKFLVTGSKWTG